MNAIIQSLQGLSFDASDRELFSINDAERRVLALQDLLWPKLHQLLQASQKECLRIFGDRCLDGLKVAARPKPKWGSSEVSRFEDAHIGLTGSSNEKGLTLLKPDGSRSKYGVAALYFEVSKEGGLTLVFRPVWHYLNPASQATVRAVLREAIDSLKAVGDAYSLELHGESGNFEDSVDARSSFRVPPLQLPVDEPSHLSKLVEAFVALFPWLRAITNVSVGTPADIQRLLALSKSPTSERVLVPPPALMPAPGHVSQQTEPPENLRLERRPTSPVAKPPVSSVNPKSSVPLGAGPGQAGRKARTAPRRRAREFALQGLYQRQLSGNAPAAIRAQLAEAGGFALADQPYFDALWDGVVADYDALVVLFTPLLDRRAAELSPIERAILVIGAWELRNRQEIPYRVVINEAVELAKSYGATDGHKFVNGVLDGLAATLRADEVRALAAERAAGGA